MFAYPGLSRRRLRQSSQISHSAPAWQGLSLSRGGNLRRVEVTAGAAQADGSQQVMSGLAAGVQVVSNALQLSSTVEQK
jgi:hypothetical protein